MVSDPDLFVAVSYKEVGQVKTGSNLESLLIEGIGSIQIMGKNGPIIINNVYFVPDLSTNLLSVRCLVLAGYHFMFEKN